MCEQLYNRKLNFKKLESAYFCSGNPNNKYYMRYVRKFIGTVSCNITLTLKVIPEVSQPSFTSRCHKIYLKSSYYINFIIEIIHKAYFWNSTLETTPIQIIICLSHLINCILSSVLCAGLELTKSAKQVKVHKSVFLDKWSHI